MMQAATTQIATSNMKTMDPTAAPMITVVLLPSRHGYRKCKIIQKCILCWDGAYNKTVELLHTSTVGDCMQATTFCTLDETDYIWVVDHIHL